MSRDNVGNKQTIILHNCIINDERYDLVITPHRQTIGYIRTRRQTLRKEIINKQKQMIRKLFSKRRNASTKKLNLKNDKNKLQTLLQWLFMNVSHHFEPKIKK